MFTSRKVFYKKIRETNDCLRLSMQHTLHVVKTTEEIHKKFFENNEPNQKILICAKDLDDKDKGLLLNDLNIFPEIEQEENNPILLENIEKYESEDEVDGETEEIITEETYMNDEEAQRVEDAGFWKEIEIPLIIPDDLSSGSESEIFENDSKPQKIKKSDKDAVEKPRILPLANVTATKTQTMPIQRKTRSKSISKQVPKSNLKSLNLYTYDFPEQTLDTSESPSKYNSFRSTLSVKKQLKQDNYPKIISTRKKNSPITMFYSPNNNNNSLVSTNMGITHKFSAEISKLLFSRSNTRR